MSYFSKKGKESALKVEDQPGDVEGPVLSEEDEAFLHRIATEGTPPPLPERPHPQDLPVAGETGENNAQLVLLTDAQKVPLPSAPDTPADEIAPAVESEAPDKGKGKLKEKKKAARWSFLRRDSRDSKRKAKEDTAAGLMGVAEGLKAAEAQPNEHHVVSDPEAKKEEAEMTAIMDDLNLAAVDNRVFSISSESKELLQKFTLVLKDLMNGVPTAYDDLESLLTNSENQLERSYKHLPAFLQDLIKKLPSKMTQSIGPEMLAAAAEKQGINSKYMNKGAHAAEKMGIKVRVPSLKDLVTKPGAVAGLLKTIMNFLKLRFPAFLGLNVLYSLGLFILLFVFWYCHKRGKEVRLEKERALTEQERAELDERLAAEDTTPRDTTTIAPEGADIEEVRAGMRVREGEDAALTETQGAKSEEERREERILKGAHVE
ncbi:MAG: hypothetical protein Q9182_001399 [Xanthomendoza sp. 2 TL-2023]